MTLMLRVGEQPVLQDLLGAKRIAAVDQGHVMAVVGHVERFLDRGIAAADHRDLLAAIEEAVAGRAGRSALALHMLFGRQAEPLGLGAGGDDQRVGMIFGAAVALQHERAARQVDLDDMVPDHLGADMLGLGLHLLHQPRALDDVAEAGIIFDVGGGGQLAAGLDALDDDRRQAGAGGVNGGGQAGRAGAEDEQAGGNDVGHGAHLRALPRGGNGPANSGQ